MHPREPGGGLATRGVSSAAALERWAVRLVAIHSALVGVALLLAPEGLFAIFGWSTLEPLFFVRQGGVFHCVLAWAYLLEYRRSGGVALLVTAKTTAFVFLTSIWLLGEGAWVVPLSGVTDGLMGLAVAWLHRWAAASGPADPPR